MAQDAVDQLEIASPCTVSWSSMRGDDRVRFCGQCRQNVYNVAGFSRAEARRLVAEGEGRLCVRLLRRPDGTVVTADCWARLRAARRRGLVPFVAMLLVVGWAELVAMRFGLDAWRRPPAPEPSLVLELEPLVAHSMGLGGLRRPPRLGRRANEDRVHPPPAAPHLSPPLVNPVLAGLPD